MPALNHTNPFSLLHVIILNRIDFFCLIQVGSEGISGKAQEWIESILACGKNPNNREVAMGT
jgi:hypothetical protein